MWRGTGGLGTEGLGRDPTTVEDFKSFRDPFLRIPTYKAHHSSRTQEIQTTCDLGTNPMTHGLPSPAPSVLSSSITGSGRRSREVSGRVVRRTWDAVSIVEVPDKDGKERVCTKRRMLRGYG